MVRYMQTVAQCGMAKIAVVIPAKRRLDAAELARCLDFESKLHQAMVMAANRNAIRLSSIDPKYIGVEGSPKNAPAMQGVLQDFKKASGHNYAVNQAHDFLSSQPKMHLQRAHYGYPIEAETQKIMEEHFSSSFMRARGNTSAGGDYLYNDPAAYPALGFPINFKGDESGGARPDWRLKLPKSGGEAIFDATSEGQKEHLKRKKVGGQTLDEIDEVLYGSEIIYETRDAYFDTSPKSKAFLWELALLAVEVAGLALATYVHWTYGDGTQQ